MGEESLKFVGTIAKSGHDDEGVFRYIITIPKDKNKFASKFHGKNGIVIFTLITES